MPKIVVAQKRGRPIQVLLTKLKYPVGGRNIAKEPIWPSDVDYLTQNSRSS